MAFGDNKKTSGEFGQKGGSFGGELPKKIGLKTTGSLDGHFGTSNKGASFGGNNFGAKSHVSTIFGATVERKEEGASRKRTTDDMPVLSRADIRSDEKPSQIKRTKIVTFSNVEWKKFDNIRIHPSGAEYNEPRIHVIANRDNIEFHGYNVSEMDEGVYYKIGRNDDFEIECDVDTTQIIPHPGGYFYISFGIISAMINETGGSFLLDNKKNARVGSRFTMKLSLTESGKYEVFINGEKQGEEFKATVAETKIVFGFKHDSHNCELLSHAYVKRIKMKQSKGFDSGGFGPSNII